MVEADEHNYVAASAINGVKKIEVTLSKEQMENTTYTVKLYFAEIEEARAKGRVFDVIVQGQKQLANFNIAKEAGGSNKLIYKTIENVSVKEKLAIEFAPNGKEVLPMLSGIEIQQENRSTLSQK
jgi:hypothetical protein